MRADIVLDTMKRNDIPMTRENYLNLAYFGTPPAELDAEEEMSLPTQFQLNPGEEFE